MIRTGTLSASQRAELLALVRSGGVEHRVARRANAVLLLDDGWSCEEAARVLYVDDDTVRTWRKIYDESGVSDLERFEGGGGGCPAAVVKRIDAALNSDKPGLFGIVCGSVHDER